VFCGEREMAGVKVHDKFTHFSGAIVSPTELGNFSVGKLTILPSFFAKTIH